MHSNHTHRLNRSSAAPSPIMVPTMAVSRAKYISRPLSCAYSRAGEQGYQRAQHQDGGCQKQSDAVQAQAHSSQWKPDRSWWLVRKACPAMYKKYPSSQQGNQRQPARQVNFWIVCVQPGGQSGR